MTQRLTTDRKAEVAAMLEDGASHKEIARTLGVATATIRRHFPGTGWTQSQTAKFVNSIRDYMKEVAA